MKDSAWPIPVFAMPVRLEGRVLGCINLTWHRRVLSLTGMVQRHLDDLRTAVGTVEERAHVAGPGHAV